MNGFAEPAQDFFRVPAQRLAPKLIGCLLRRETGRGVLSGVVVETEAYTRDDPASHSFRGRTDRNGPMFRGGGYAYVYLVYGIHHCFNVTSGPPGSGEAVLVRAVRPLEGLEMMMRNRGTDKPEDLCRGPGRLCSAFGIDRRHSGVSLESGKLRILVPEADEALDIAATGRIGIRKGTELELRFCLRDSKWVSG